MHGETKMYDLMNPPANGLVVMAVSDWEADVALQAILDTEGIKYNLCSGVFNGIGEDGLILEWNDWRKYAQPFCRDDGQECVLLVKQGCCFTVNVTSVCGTGFLVQEHLTALQRHNREPVGNYTQYDALYYTATPSLEKRAWTF